MACCDTSHLEFIVMTLQKRDFRCRGVEIKVSAAEREKDGWSESDFVWHYATEEGAEASRV